MNTHRLNLKPLTPEGFAAFGEVIQKQGHQHGEINYGKTRKYIDLAQIDVGDEQGTATVHIYRSRPVGLPFKIEVMEYHPLGGQVFFPLHQRPFPIVVAPPGEQILFTSIRGFITNGEQGVNLHRGVWHHYQLSLDEPSDYLVIERKGPGINTIEQHLKKALFIEKI